MIDVMLQVAATKAGIDLIRNREKLLEFYVGHQQARVMESPEFLAYRQKATDRWLEGGSDFDAREDALERYVESCLDSRPVEDKIGHAIVDGLKAAGSTIWDQNVRDFHFLRYLIANRQEAYKKACKYIETFPAYSWHLIKETFAEVRDNPEMIIPLALKAAGVAIGFSLGFSGLVSPDMDIALLGIGSHRNWFTHSAVPVMMLAGLAKFLDRKTSVNPETTAVEVKKDIKEFGSPLFAGYAGGFGAHLIADFLTPKDVLGFPFGMVFSGGIILDSVWLLANGLLCFSLVDSNRTFSPAKVFAFAEAIEKERVAEVLYEHSKNETQLVFQGS